jgi:hypothetical protein
MRGLLYAASAIHDNVVAFLGFKSAAGNCSYPWKTDTLAGLSESGNDRSGIQFGEDTAGVGSYWTSTPVQMAFYYDYQKSNFASASADSLYGDSVSNGVQCISIGGGPALGMLTGTLVTTSAGDLNGDGFNEREGAYVVKATNNQAQFILPALPDTCRYYPAFRVTNYISAEKPQFVYCYHLHHIGGSVPDTLTLLDGYNYNSYLNASTQELIMQMDSVFCDSTAFFISADKTLAVGMDRFNAAGGDGCDTIKWRTESENQNIGYYLYRRVKPAFFDSLAKAASRAPDSLLDDAASLVKQKTIASADTGWVRLNNQIIPGAPSGASVGPRDYLHIDARNIHDGILYEYKVIAVDYQNSSSTYGPAEAKPVSLGCRLKFALGNIYPNPFRKDGVHQVRPAGQDRRSSSIFTISRGKLIKRLLRPDKNFPAGFHSDHLGRPQRIKALPWPPAPTSAGSPWGNSPVRKSL